MTNAIARNLQICVSRLLSCSMTPMPRHNLSAAPDGLPPSPPSAQSSASYPAVVFKNFNSLYDPTAPSSGSDTPPASNSAMFTATAAATTASSSSSSSSSTAATTPAERGRGHDHDILSAIASRRLLPPSSPGRSNAIADSTAVAVGIGVAVPTYSPDPHADFLGSMEEMAAALGLLGPPRSRECRRRRRERLYELLLCYLALNRRHAHKFIVGAFADLLVRITREEECGAGGE